MPAPVSYSYCRSLPARNHDRIAMQDSHVTKVCLIQSSPALAGDKTRSEMQSCSIVGAYRHGSTFQSSQHARFSHRRALGCYGPPDASTVKRSSDISSCCSSDTGSVRYSSGSATRCLGSYDGAPTSAAAHYSGTGMPEENPARVDTRVTHEIPCRSGEDWPSNCSTSHNSAGAAQYPRSSTGR